MFKQILIISAAFIAISGHAQSDRVKITFKKALPLAADGRVWIQDGTPYYLGSGGQATSLYGKVVTSLKNAPQCGILTDVRQKTVKFDENTVLTGQLVQVNTQRRGITHSLYLVDFYQSGTRVAQLMCNSHDAFSNRPLEAGANQVLTHETVSKILGSYATVEAAQ